MTPNSFYSIELLKLALSSAHTRLHYTLGLHCIGDLARVNGILSVYHYFSGLLFLSSVASVCSWLSNFPRMFSTTLHCPYIQLLQNPLLIDSTDHEQHNLWPSKELESISSNQEIIASC